VNLCDPTKQTSSLPNNLGLTFFFFPPKKVLVVGECIISVTKKCPGSMVVVLVIWGEAEEAKAEILICAFFYDVDDFVPCEKTHFLPAKTLSSLPLWKRLQGSIPSFLSKHLQGSVHSFLSTVRHWEACAQVCVWEERECFCYLSFIEGLFLKIKNNN